MGATESPSATFSVTGLIGIGDEDCERRRKSPIGTARVEKEHGGWGSIEGGERQKWYLCEKRLGNCSVRIAF
jgi:hypothetical protein